MTGHATAEADEDDFAFGIVLIALILFTLLADVAFAAFIYKVWNERQMTHEYHAQAVELHRMADSFEFFAEEAAAKKPVRLSRETGRFELRAPALTLPTLGGTAQEPAARACGAEACAR